MLCQQEPAVPDGVQIARTAGIRAGPVILENSGFRWHFGADRGTLIERILCRLRKLTIIDTIQISALATICRRRKYRSRIGRSNKVMQTAFTTLRTRSKRGEWLISRTHIVEEVSAKFGDHYHHYGFSAVLTS